ncbi:MAG: SIMPL domain-containing protein [Rikenellaceae bacterium]
MRRFILLFAAIAVVATASASNVVNFVEVSGKAEIKVTPNEFTLAITIDEQATKGKYTVQEVEKKMIAAIKKIGIEQEALTMSGMSSLAIKRKEALTTASYELQLNSVEQIGECYAAFDNLAITNVRISKATNSEMESYRSKARVAAIKDAQTRASEIGEALGQEVGACFELTDRSSYANEAVYMNYATTRTNAMAADSAEPVEFRDITITYNVDAKFLLELSDEQQMMIINIK